MSAIQLWPSQVLAFIRLGRPHFLVGGFLLHGLGIAMALYSGVRLNLAALLWGQVAITAIQWMTHYSNDFFDLTADKANPTPTHWSGGSRVLIEGHLSSQVALIAAIVLGVVALSATLVSALMVQPGMFTVLLLCLALILAWGYSAPPLQLHSRGLGELAAALLVPGLTPLVGFYLQAGRLTLLPFLAVWPLCCLQFAMLLSIEFPDAAGDAAVGKRTLVVRLGGSKAASLGIAVLILAYGSLPVLVWLGLPLAVAVAACLSTPVAVRQGWRLRRRTWAEPASWNSLAFWSVGLLMSATVFELLAFLLLSSR